MIIRGTFAVARAKLLQLARNPIAVITCAAFLLLASGLPAVAAPSRAERLRQAASWLVSAASALLFLSAMLIPISGGAPRTRLREARILGTRSANFGHGIAGLLFVVFLGGLLALVSWGWLAFRFPDPDMTAGDPVLRRVVYRNAAPVVIEPGVSWSSGPITVGSNTRTFQIEMVPKLRFREARSAEETATRPSAQTLELKWHAGGRSRTRLLTLSGKPIVETVEIGDEGKGAGALAVELRLLARDLELRLDPGAVAVLGVRCALFPSVVRSLLVVAFTAAIVGAAAHWFSNFVGPLIAVSAALTLVIAFMTFRAVAPASGDVAWWSSFVPGDPVAALRRGHETGWGEVLRSCALGAVATTVAAALSAHGPERRDA